MSNITEQKCPECGAPLRFDPARGLMVCDYCDKTVELPQQPEAEPQEPEVDGFDFNSLGAQASQENADAVPIYNCVSCGAEVITPPEQAALTCPYCGNNIVLTQKVSGKLRPDGLIPFKLDARDLPARMNSFYRDKVLLPRRFFSDSTMGKVTGVYVPFWIFNGRMTGVLDFTAHTSVSRRQGDYTVTTTSHYALRRDVDLSFRDVPVDASGRIDDDLMDSLEPFDMTASVPFDMRYLAGFTADRFDREKGDVAPRAKERMIRTADKVVTGRVGGEYAGVRRVGGELHSQLQARYLLLPVYLFEIAHGGRSYRFAVNGQTGKVVGDVPTDGGVSRMYFLKRLGATVAAVLGLLFGKYLLGW